ncbi:MAG: hypothetical protein AAB802_03490 [Patescibacteria group bacterium]
MEFDDQLDPTDETEIGDHRIVIIERPYSPEKRFEMRGDLGFKRMMNGADSIDWTEKEGAVAAVKGAEALLAGKAADVRFAIQTKHNNGALKESEKAGNKINKLNEDGFLVIQHKGRTIMVVFDGVGGENGFKGTEMAAVAFYESIREDATLKEALEKANEVLYRFNKLNRSKGMAATVIVAAEMEGDEGEMVWAGDAEGQLLDEDSEPVFETVPHNQAALGFQVGLSRQEYWKNRKARGPIYSGLGIEAHPVIGEMHRRKLKPGWRFALRSDGATDNSSPYETAQLLKGRRNSVKALDALFAHQEKVAGQEQINIEDVEADGTHFTTSQKPKGDNVTMGVMDYLGDLSMESVAPALTTVGWTEIMRRKILSVVESSGLAAWFRDDGQA